MNDKPEGFLKSCLFVFFALFVVVPLGSYLLAGLLVSGESALQREYSGASIVAVLSLAILAWAILDKRKKAQLPKCPRCFGKVNEGATECGICGRKLFG
jgi:hypothetical protein